MDGGWLRKRVRQLLANAQQPCLKRFLREPRIQVSHGPFDNKGESAMQFLRAKCWSAPICRARPQQLVVGHALNPSQMRDSPVLESRSHDLQQGVGQVVYHRGRQVSIAETRQRTPCQ